MAYLSREEILQADDIKRDTVDTPEWGGSVLVRGLNAEQYLDMGFDLRTDDDTLNPEKVKAMMPTIVSMGVIDEDGEPLFTEADIKPLAKKSFGPVNRISTRILELSGLRTGEEDAKN